MDNCKIVDLMDREIDIQNLPDETKSGLRTFYYEMPDGVRMDIALNFREIFPEVSPQMYLHLDRAGIDEVIKRSSKLLGIFDNEFKKARFSFPMTWFDKVRSTVFMGAWDTDSFLYGLRYLTTLYHEALDLCNRRDEVALKFLMEYLRAWLRQKEAGMAFFNKTFRSPEYYRLTQKSITLCEIIDEYLHLDKLAVASKMGLENLFYTILQAEPSEKEEDNIFVVLDVARAAGVHTTIERADVMNECVRVSTMTESYVADNTGQVSIFGTLDPTIMPIDQVREELLRLNRNTIADFFHGKFTDTNIAFDLSDQVKMMLREELSPNLCAVTIKRGNELDIATLLTHESKTYLLFRRIGEDDTTYGISLGTMEHGERELIGISNETDFTYTLVGGEEIGVN